MGDRTIGLPSNVGATLLFWGKAKPEASAIGSWHPLVFHCLDVAATGLALLERRALPRSLTLVLGDRWPGALGYLLALHDIGKLSRPFLAQCPEHWPAAVLGPHKPPASGFRHDVMGLTLLQHLLDPVVAPQHFLADWSWNQAKALLAPFVGHHGRPVAPRVVDRDDIFGAELVATGHDVLDLMAALFQPHLPKPQTRAMRADLARASWDLAGLCVLADWIGSRQGWFPYRPDINDPVAYWHDCALPQARRAVEQAGLVPSRPALVTGYRALTGDDGAAHAPSPVQRWAEEVALPDGPVLALIEDMTGSGKTEAALILAHRLLAGGRARGLYVALPTMATANAMYARLRSCYRRLFERESSPSLALAHGAAALHDGFRESVTALAGCDGAVDHADADEPGGDEAGAACAAWIADSRRKTFLADVGVGTIDQALLAVLPAKYQALRLFGLGNQVLVVDEAHAYDAYMGSELERLLEFQAALGGSAIVLSATLPLAKRQALARKFAKGLGAATPTLARSDYPLAALIAGNGVREDARGTRPGLARTLSVSRLADAGEAVRRIVEAARAGAAVAWVRNTVDDTFAAIALLRAEGVTADLFHARYAMGDRLTVEDKVVRRFGKAGDPAGRNRVLVATQVIEQSLDLDFDLMVSDLAPVDLLLQRAGRLWRHDRGGRLVAEPHLLVVSPDPAGPVGHDWCRAALPGTAAIYRDHGVLWLTADALFRETSWRIPEDVRHLVEAVYGPEVRQRLPAALETAGIKAEGENRAAGCLAETNLLKVDNGYDGEHSGWAEDNHILTRLGEETTVLRLARWHDGAFQPWCEAGEPHRAWALSEVSVRSHLARVTPALTASQAAAATRTRATWTRHDAEKLLVPLESVADGVWQGQVIGEGERVTTFRYTSRLGLQFDGAPV